MFVEQGQRRIPVQFAKRVVGRRMYGGQSTYIPLKVNQSGVIPIIFASSVLYLPLLHHATCCPTGGWGDDGPAAASTTTSCQPDVGSCYLVVFGAADHRLRLLLHGHHRSTRAKQADHDPQAGRLHPRHPARPADRALPAKILTRITLPGALFLAVVALLPVARCSTLVRRARNFPFAGTSILIAVGVALETMKQIDSQLMMRNYEGFLK